jgi:hypothetical protein
MRLWPLLAALTCALHVQPAAAQTAVDDRQAVEQLRATTLALIEALVGQGLLSRERADALLKASRAPTPAPVPPPTAPAAAPGWGSPPVVRVPYIPETVRAQIREEVKNDVLATAREERWADSRQVPDWVRGITLEGDVRVRWQSERYGSGNLPAEAYRAQTTSPAWSPDLTNTTVDRDRLTLRARLGALAKVGDDTTAGVRLSTGSTSGPTSSSQTLGTGFNKASVVLDRAWLRWEPRYDVRAIAGRMANPFFGTDLLWPDDLGFDGLALQAEQNLASGVYAFATAGAFPLQEFANDTRDSWLYGAQIGVDWALGSNTQWRTGLAVYDFHAVEGRRENDPPPSGPRAGTVPYFNSQYPASLRLKGNTLINLNDPTSTAAPTWGLASKFSPINLTSSLTFRHFDPLRAELSVDWVKNSAFDINDISARAGAPLSDVLSARNTGLQLRASLGMAALEQRGDWQAFVALRRFERDAWIDGFTDTTWNLGGTNYKGWSLGGHYAFDRRTSLGLRLTSTRNLDDGYRFLAVPGNASSLSGNLSSAPLKIDVMQIDLNARF